MLKEYPKLTIKIVKLLDEDPGQTVKGLAKQLKVNRTFLAGYLEALEDQGCVRSKKIGPAKVYFNKKPRKSLNKSGGFRF
jgi:predicted transcriptional regulator